MVQKIACLPEVVINQIAAGEVVENPSSIIKELIENSLDAGASHITVSIVSGGQLKIEVEDDGCGMSPEDAVLCFERHATSKIRSAEDLSSLSTMGFRGEALAAIASVSHFTLKTSDGMIGTLVRGKGGVIEEVVPCARNRGTTLTISFLFFNMPARKKFQKSHAANTAQVTKVIELMSLANPSVSFSYHVQDHQVYRFGSQTVQERVESVFGTLEHVHQGDGLFGFFSAPERAKTNRKEQIVFINKRPVFSPLISKAVQMGYGTRLKENTYPPFVLFLEIDSSLVDVNVHPQKKEVRFANESALFNRVEQFVGDMFSLKQKAYPSFLSTPRSFEEPLPFLLEEAPIMSPPKMVQEVLALEVPERVLAVIGKYCLLEKDGLFLVDLQGASARICFEELKEGRGEAQTLLWPLEVDAEEEDFVLALQKMGIECRWIGKKKIAIDALPCSIDPLDFPTFFHAWKEGRRLEDASIRCFVYRNKRFSSEEAIDIWRRLQLCKDCLYDPLGNKIWAKIELMDLELWLRGSMHSKRG